MNVVSNSEALGPRDAPWTDDAAEPARFGDFVASVRAMVRRRYLTFLAVAAAAFALAAVLILLITPQYESVARVRIDPSRNPLATTNDTNVGLTAESIDTEATVLSSPELARDVVNRLNLANDPEFTKGLAQPNASWQVTREERLNAVTDEVLRHLDVRREKLTYIIAVGFKSRDPVKAARIANSFARTYIETRVGSRTSTAESQAKWFAEQLAKLATEVQVADARVAQYRAQAGIVQGGTSGTITDQQVAPLSTQLASAQSDAAEARAKLAEARRQVAAGGLDAVSEVRNSTVIADLRRQRAEVVRNMGEITSRYGEKHPETIKVRQQLKQLDDQINDEANRAVGSLQAAADAASARAASLAGSMASLKTQQAANTRAAVIAEGLERDATTKRAAYDKMAQMRMEAVQSARNIISNAEIVDPGRVPLKPAAPRKPLLFALAALVALALGFGTITAQELLAGGMRSIADVEDRLRLTLLASIPLLAARKGGSPADTLLTQPASIFAEALRNARASILGVRTGAHPRVVALTSALPEEGKTTVALSLARILGMNGTRTLLIDCDLRKASLLPLLPAHQPTGGLVQVLRGEIGMEQAIVADSVDNLDVLPVDEKLFTAEDLFGDGRMAALLDAAKAKYQVVVLDLPPVMGVADARTLAVLADVTALIVRWGSTPARAAEAALAWLRSDGARVSGAIYTMVDPNSEAVGGLFYSGKYAAYYQKG